LKNAKVCKSTTKEKTSRGQDYKGQDYKGQDYKGQDYKGQDYKGQDYKGQDYKGQDYKGQVRKNQFYLFIIIFVFYDIIPISQITQLYLNHKIPKTVFKGGGLNTQTQKPLLYTHYINFWVI
jgi:hypothetical protein